MSTFKYEHADRLDVFDFHYVAIRTTKSIAELRRIINDASVYTIVAQGDVKVLIVNSESEMSVMRSKMSWIFCAEDSCDLWCGEHYSITTCLDEAVSDSAMLNCYTETMLDKKDREQRDLDRMLAIDSVQRLREPVDNTEEPQSVVIQLRRRCFYDPNHKLLELLAVISRNLDYFMDQLLRYLIVESSSKDTYSSLTAWRCYILSVCLQQIDRIDANKLRPRLYSKISDAYQRNSKLLEAERSTIRRSFIMSHMKGRDRLLQNNARKWWAELSSFTRGKIDAKYSDAFVDYQLVHTHRKLRDDGHTTDIVTVHGYQHVECKRCICYSLEDNHSERTICGYTLCYVDSFDTRFYHAFVDTCAMFLLGNSDNTSAISLLGVDVVRHVLRCVLL